MTLAVGGTRSAHRRSIDSIPAASAADAVLPFPVGATTGALACGAFLGPQREGRMQLTR